MSGRLNLRELGEIEQTQLPTFAEVSEVRPPETVGAAGTLGVILPLSGPFARFGEESLQGVLEVVRGRGRQHRR